MEEVSRRHVTGLALGGLALGASAMKAHARWESVTRYPDPAFEILDETFTRYRLDAAGVEQLWTGARWSEGPVWVGDQRCLLWSDIPNNRTLRWSEVTGEVDEFRNPSNFANGHTRDRQGRIISCEHGERRVTRLEYDGSITVLADRFEGKRLNSPNDVVVRSDGTIWFTDPLFGIGGDYEGERAESEIPAAVYCADPSRGTLRKVAEGVPGPNGLAFSPDEGLLYLVASRAEPRQILSYPVRAGGVSLGEARVLVEAEADGTPDGFRVDEDGNLWCGWGMGRDGLDGVRVFNASGAPIGHVDLPERVANVAFGGWRRNRLFMAGCRSLYSVFVNTRGC